MNDWLSEESNRSEKQAKKGVTVNNKVKKKKEAKKVERVLKGYRPQVTIENQFNLLIAEQKNIKGKSSPELIDEALLYVIKKYRKTNNK